MVQSWNAQHIISSVMLNSEILVLTSILNDFDRKQRPFLGVWGVILFNSSMPRPVEVEFLKGYGLHSYLSGAIMHRNHKFKIYYMQTAEICY